MKFAELHDYCAALPGATAGFPFGDLVLVFKVGGKMFATLTPDEIPPAMNLKCEPERALLLREEYPSIRPGYYMNKRHWNTITMDGAVPRALVIGLIDHSYDLVVAKLSRAQREGLPTNR